MGVIPFKKSNAHEAIGIPTISTQEKIARIRLYRSQNVGSVTYRNLLSKYKCAIKALEALPELAARGGLNSNLELYSESNVIEELEKHEKIGSQLVVDGEHEFPDMLQGVYESPPVLSIKGNTKYFGQKSVSIVGARNCSINGKKIAYLLAKELGAEGYTLISGLAKGIDAQAHRGSINTGTIAVIAGGIDQQYPSENKKLYEEIYQKGVVVTESAIGTEPKGCLFPKRNYLISSLSQGIIVIEAALQSGSLITARYATELNRDVFVVPGSPLDPRYHGSNDLIRSGANLITCAQDVVDVLNEPYKHVLHESQNNLENYQYIQEKDDNQDEKSVTNLRVEILENLTASPIHIDELLRECGYSSSLVLSTLLELELAGKVQRHPGNKISI